MSKQVLLGRTGVIMPEATDYYVPVLRWKRGEQVALQNLKATTKPLVDPLLVLEPLDYDPAGAGGHDPSFDLQLDQQAASLIRYWQANPAAIDLSRTDPQARYGGTGVHFLEALFDQLRAEAAHMRPVVTLDSDPAFRASVRAICAVDGQGAVLRLSAFDVTPNTPTEIDQLLGDIGLTPGEVDLLLDAAQNVLPTNVIASICTNVIAGLPQLPRWRRLTVAAGGFPESLSALSVGTQTIQRNCLTLWQAIRSLIPARQPGLGDYTMVHPEPIEITGYMNPSASIKYTVDAGWLILRGQGTRTAGTGGFAQFRAHAINLVARPEYCGQAFSWADAYIADVASGAQGTGNLETWVRIGVNHHSLPSIGSPITPVLKNSTHLFSQLVNIQGLGKPLVHGFARLAPDSLVSTDRL